MAKTNKTILLIASFILFFVHRKQFLSHLFPDFCPPSLMGQLAILSGPALPVQSRFPKGHLH